MAITVSAIKPSGGAKSYRGAYSNQKYVTATLSFASIAAAAEDTGDITVPGVLTGDHVIAYGFNADPEENIFFYQVFVTAANTVTLSVTNASGSSDTPAPTQIKFIVGRPTW
jgi:hypothetical protein